jgi:hypothetical protein
MPMVFLKMARPFGILFRKILSSVNDLKWVSVFFNWAILFWKGKYRQLNDLKWVSVFFNWVILFWKGKYLQLNDLKWVSAFFNWVILLWKRLYKPNG